MQILSRCGRVLTSNTLRSHTLILKGVLKNKKSYEEFVEMSENLELKKKKTWLRNIQRIDKLMLEKRRKEGEVCGGEALFKGLTKGNKQKEKTCPQKLYRLQKIIAAPAVSEFKELDLCKIFEDRKEMHVCQRCETRCSKPRKKKLCVEETVKKNLCPCPKPRKPTRTDDCKSKTRPTVAQTKQKCLNTCKEIDDNALTICEPKVNVNFKRTGPSGKIKILKPKPSGPCNKRLTHPIERRLPPQQFCEHSTSKQKSKKPPKKNKTTCCSKKLTPCPEELEDCLNTATTSKTPPTKCTCPDFESKKKEYANIKSTKCKNIKRCV